MIFRIDAQRPPSLAVWLAKSFGVEAHALRGLGLRDAVDTEIHAKARRAGVVLVSKDSDFVELTRRHGVPPQLLWVTCDNVTNRHLQSAFSKAFPAANTLLAAGEAIVEIGLTS